MRLCSVIFVLYVMSIVIKTCTESQNCSQGSAVAFLSVFVVSSIYNNAAFAESLGFLYVQEVLTQWYQFSHTALWPLSEQDNLDMKPISVVWCFMLDILWTNFPYSSPPVSKFDFSAASPDALQLWPLQFWWHRMICPCYMKKKKKNAQKISFMIWMYPRIRTPNHKRLRI